MNTKPNILRLAVQKSGRLSEDSMALVSECSINFKRRDNKLKSQGYGFPIEFLYLRDDDIPEYVSNGIADIGIVGQNLVVEKQRPVEIIEMLGFSRCRLSIAVPKAFNYQSLQDLNGLRIATSYPHTLRAFLQENNIAATIKEISGSVEISPSIGLAEAVCDLVSSGSTLVINGLKEAEVVSRSEAVLIKGKNLSEEKNEILERLLFRVRSVQNAKTAKYILLNAPNDSIAEITEILPGVTSPTILPLVREGWSSLHAVIDESDFWEVIEQLKAAKAEGILIVPLEKMIA